jgi:hypothetical protein
MQPFWLLHLPAQCHKMLLYHPIEPVTLNDGTNLNQMTKNDDGISILQI